MGDVFKTPHAIRDAGFGFHCWSNAQCLVNPAEIVVHVVERNRRRVILDFLREAASIVEHQNDPVKVGKLWGLAEWYPGRKLEKVKE